jgi:hypothetical protein
MAPLVPLSKRRDLRPPAYLHLDLAERFPRIGVRVPEGVVADGALHGLYGPFRDRRAAERALKPLHKRFALRPCDYVFEPDPHLALGENCLYAQVRTCAAPCLERVSGAEYQALARQLAGLLAQPDARPADLADVVPVAVSAAWGRAVIVEPVRTGIELYPCLDGAVLDEQRVDLTPAELEPEAGASAALDRLTWASPASGRDDRAWLAAHLLSGSGGTAYLTLPSGASARALLPHLRART